MMRERRLRRLSWSGALVAVLLASAAPAAALDCRDPAFHWSEGEPPINRRHVFCGEIGNGRPKGFHSSRLAATSPVVTAIAEQSAGRDGIYDAMVRFHNGTTKFSTFFPDACTVEQVVASIRYAATHVERAHPQWGHLGPSAPDRDDDGFCRDAVGHPFEIRIGFLRDGRVNTAFPD